MELQTISEVSKAYNVSTRTLRYYEQIGLITSIKQDDYSYRSYSSESLLRLQQIIILRKLRIPLKQIGDILSSKNAITALDIFRKNLNEIDEEITSLSAIKTILSNFIENLNKSIQVSTKLDLLGDKTLLDIVNVVSVTKRKFKEEKSMDEFNSTNTLLPKLKNVRILYIPPMTIAASRFYGKNPEDNAMEMMHAFVRSTKLYNIKPDIRIFGFDNPCEQDAEGNYGYEFWVTIPSDMDVPAPLEKKHFEGGLYGAHSIKMGNFHEWQLLSEWAKNNDEYGLEMREPEGMNGWLEEHMNAYYFYANSDKEHTRFTQLDLLIPIKKAH
jgi:DNA-binding transcriptional MerR regulator